MAQSPPSLTGQIVRTVATETGTDPLELPPLYGAIDPTALNAVVQESTDCTVTFQFAECAVTVESCSGIHVDERPVASVSADTSAGKATE